MTGSPGLLSKLQHAAQLAWAKLLGPSVLLESKISTPNPLEMEALFGKSVYKSGIWSLATFDYRRLLHELMNWNNRRDGPSSHFPFSVRLRHGDFNMAGSFCPVHNRCPLSTSHPLQSRQGPHFFHQKSQVIWKLTQKIEHLAWRNMTHMGSQKNMTPILCHDRGAPVTWASSAPVLKYIDCLFCPSWGDTDRSVATVARHFQLMSARRSTSTHQAPAWSLQPQTSSN